jgi:hypothetical protein
MLILSDQVWRDNSIMNKKNVVLINYHPWAYKKRQIKYNKFLFCNEKKVVYV